MRAESPQTPQPRATPQGNGIHKQRPERAKVITHIYIFTFALSGRFVYILNTQGVALGQGLAGLSARYFQMIINYDIHLLFINDISYDISSLFQTIIVMIHLQKQSNSEQKIKKNLNQKFGRTITFCNWLRWFDLNRPSKPIYTTVNLPHIENHAITYRQKECET